MVWRCAQEELLLYWTKGPECGAAREEENGKTTEAIHGCSEGGHPKVGVTKEWIR